jgi:hypothetical protein
MKLWAEKRYTARQLGGFSKYRRDQNLTFLHKPESWY